eukprot:TRINITY_DN47049_c0_g1_i1.p1 TRINITY_DN47049_c0_g1~~TRINITY_DN47049_c0_g1_i1.p1  ORF type:complete len:421 (-),score=98.81 TRINITY_DN47049_c0_g1_i1:87-1349(-)
MQAYEPLPLGTAVAAPAVHVPASASNVRVPISAHAVPASLAEPTVPLHSSAAGPPSNAAGSGRPPVTASAAPLSLPRTMHVPAQDVEFAPARFPPLFGGPLACNGEAGSAKAPARPTAHVERFVIILGFLLCLCSCAVPVLSSAMLLFDTNYRFWHGLSYPLAVLTCCGGMCCMLALVSILLYKKAKPEMLNEPTAALVGFTLFSLLGALLLLITLPASRDLHATAAKLRDCSGAPPGYTMLADHMQVLDNIRQTPACAAAPSIDYCSGWKLNKYTEYIRYLEMEFECGPLCPAVVTSARPALPQLSAASAATAGTHQRSRFSQRPRQEAALLATEAWPPPSQHPKLFETGLSRTPCMPIVAERLKALSWHGQDIVCWEAFMLICAGLFASAASLLSMMCRPAAAAVGGKAASVPPRATA